MRQSRASCVGRRSSVSCVRHLLVCCRRARECRLRLSCASPAPAPAPPFVTLETAAGRAAKEEKLGYGWFRSAQPLSRTFFKIKNPLFHHSRDSAMAMAAAISNPQRHRYLVAFFQNSAMPWRCHGRFLITLQTNPDKYIYV